jgi:hypothetical protein
MWYRLKSSLLTAAVATVLVLGFLTVAVPAAEPTKPFSPLHGLTSLDAEGERAAYALAVTLTALAIDAVIETRKDEAPKAEAPPVSAPDRSHLSAIRMPFYSFAAKAARRTESGA